MSVDLLRSRLSRDIADAIDLRAAFVVDARSAPLDDLRFEQGVIAGLRQAKDLLDERYQNLHAIG
jgi:hypothetical protein